MTIMDKDDLESEIKAAFEGVRLEKGMSLRQAYAADDLNEGVTAK